MDLKFCNLKLLEVEVAAGLAADFLVYNHNANLELDCWVT